MYIKNKLKTNSAFFKQGRIGSVRIALLFTFVFVLTTSCSQMEDNYKEYLQETIYPGKVSEVTALIGIEKIYLAWTPPSDPKSKKILIKYTETDSIVTDSIVSELIVTGLKESRGYQFEIRSIDEYGNTSVAEFITAKPFNQIYIDNNIVPSEPTFTFNSSTQKGIIKWEKLTTSIMKFVSGSYELTVNGTTLSNDLVEKKRGLVELELQGIDLSQTPYTFKYTMLLMPLQANGDPIVDVVTTTRTTSKISVIR